MKQPIVRGTVLALVVTSSVGFVVYSHLRTPPVSLDDLIDPETRLLSYHRLWSQTEEARHYDFYKPLLSYSTFRRAHRSIRFVKVPVPGEPDHPVYLTLRDNDFGISHLKPPWSSWENVREWSKWKNWLFPSPHRVVAPPLEDPGPDPVKQRYVLSLHSHEGTLLDEEEPRPFGGANVTEVNEVIDDINRDGWVERVHSDRLGFKDVNDSAELLKVTRIHREPEIIFTVVINAGREPSSSQWGYACRDVDGNGTLEIEIGPKNGADISPEVTFFWNEASATFESPSGKTGPHFLVVPTENYWEILEKRAAEKRLSYPLDR